MLGRPDTMSSIEVVHHPVKITVTNAKSSMENLTETGMVDSAEGYRAVEKCQNADMSVIN